MPTIGISAARGRKPMWWEPKTVKQVGRRRPNRHARPSLSCEDLGPNESVANGQAQLIALNLRCDAQQSPRGDLTKSKIRNYVPYGSDHEARRPHP